MLLGDLNSKLTDQDRLEVITIVESYYIDFLSRVQDYGIANVPNLKKKEEKPVPKSANLVAYLFWKHKAISILYMQ